MVQTLFPEDLDLELNDRTELPAVREGPFAGIALENAIDRVLDYAIPKRLQPSLRVGQRVRVPLGRNNKKSLGYVVRIRPTTDYPRIKDVTSIDDDRVLLDEKLLELARWMSRYYFAPLGIVIESIIPAAVKKKIGLGYSQIVRLAKSRGETQEALEKTKARKRRAILARLLQLDEDGAIELRKLATESGSTPPTVRKLVRLGLITIRSETDLPRLTASLTDSAGDEPDIQFNEEQRKVFDALNPKLGGGFSVTLLHGVTGSGKTELYLQSIRKVVAGGKQAIVLVPEIALTPQTVKRFTNRFKRVAILHSGLSATERHRYWQMISQGQADVVVGARSAIFAPTKNLGMIVVDEEHESSYKSDNAPRYHARDVSIKRAQLENVPVLLGSATPSLESWHRATESRVSGVGCRVSGEDQAFNPKPEPRNPKPDSNPKPDFTLLSLPHRVRGLELAHIEVVDMRTENRLRHGVNLISKRLEYLLQTTIALKQQAILLLNRRGYSNFVYCPSCGNVIQCKYCDTTMTYHRTSGLRPEHATAAEGAHTGQLHCHYCLAVNPLPTNCPTCNKKLSLFGLGTQRVEEELARKFPDIKFARVDSDSMRNRGDYEKTLGQFARRELDVMLGTQMIAKGLDYPNVTLVGVISGDTALALPDFRAAERTFQLITQVAGRAGRGKAPGRVVLQTFQPEDPTIRAAIQQDYIRFARTELGHRKEVGLPPFTRMVRIILRDQEVEKVTHLSEELAATINSEIARQNIPATLANNGILLRGPMPCAITRIAGYFRYQILMTSFSPVILQRVLSQVRDSGALAKSDRIAVDVDPVSLL